ncbi:MAG: M20/M25/M40 family metallo-hydrolase [Oscillospiraceae bacterium]|nr:M20/M25/M40 family metallo-hydrolase [Oscillospiraceae bacterium]
MQSNPLFNTFNKLASIYSPSFDERELCDALKALLSPLGVSFEEDTIQGGSCGNLFGRLAGELNGEPILLSSHMDTVEPARGKQAILHEDGRITSDGTTILGADNISGICIILEALRRIREAGTPHRSVELLFPVAEERYGAGSALFDYSKVKAHTAFVLDLSGEIGTAANAAPTIFSFEITAAGKASHSGLAPQNGINAITAVASAISKLSWGEPEQGLTANIGLIKGGELGNIIPALCSVTGEIRSLNHNAVLKHWQRVKATFEQEAEKIGATPEFTFKTEITAYETPMDSTAVKLFKKACEKSGITAGIHPTLGGSDNNNFALHGIEGLVLACSMHEVHSVREYALLQELEQCTELLINILTEEEAK